MLETYRMMQPTGSSPSPSTQKKLIVLMPDTNERAMILRAVEKARHQPVSVETSEQAWRMIEMGQSQFVIADWDMSDVRQSQFIQRVHQTKAQRQVYILLVTTRSDDELANAGADDYLRKPLSEMDVRMRVVMADRILSLTHNLAVAREQLEHMAIYDDLTGFLNRSAFYRQAVGELERSRRGAVPFCIMAVDVENFKSITDKFGHETGSNVLRIVSQAIKEKSRPYDCVSRWSGDSFVLAVSGTIGTDAEKLAGRIIKSVHSMNVTTDTGQEITINLSAGIVAVTTVNAATEIGPLVLKARQAVGRAKESGGNQVFVLFE
jgi:diguanylate cyclase (GGDEF)-like protein